MNCISSRKLFSRYEILYLQLLSKNIDNVTINKILQYQANLARKKLDDWIHINADETVEYPIITITLSPFYKPIVMQGAECYNMLQFLVDKLENPKLLSPLDPVPYNIKKYIVRDILNCLSYKKPLVKFRDTDTPSLEFFDFWRNDEPTSKLIDTLGVELAKDQIKTQLLNFVM